MNLASARTPVSPLCGVARPRAPVVGGLALRTPKALVPFDGTVRSHAHVVRFQHVSRYSAFGAHAANLD